MTDSLPIENCEAAGVVNQIGKVILVGSGKGRRQESCCKFFGIDLVEQRKTNWDS